MARRREEADNFSYHRRSHNKPCTPSLGPQNASQEVSYGWGKRGDPPLLGDDYPLEYFDDGYPKLPECLVRRKALSRPFAHAETGEQFAFEPVVKRPEQCRKRKGTHPCGIEGVARW